MEPLEHLAIIKKKLDKNATDREKLLSKRDPIIAEARLAGYTWREIALTLGMTEHGVVKAANRNK